MELSQQSFKKRLGSVFSTKEVAAQPMLVVLVSPRLSPNLII
jgi:hypothetical protein